MGKIVYRSKNEPIRDKLTHEERWKGSDKGLINCWEVGRIRRRKDPQLAEQVKNGELPILGWKGGIEKNAKIKKKYGCLFYLAEWQGLRNEDLNIDIDEEREITCSKTGIKVIYTDDSSKW